MPHYKTMYDEKDMLFAHDLGGKDATVTIEKVWAGEISGEQGRKSKKPFVSFKGKAKKLALNKTNGKTIAQLYGTDTAAWVGKSITIYPTTTTFGNDTVECIRVKPMIPRVTSTAAADRAGHARKMGPADAALAQAAIDPAAKDGPAFDPEQDVQP